MDERQQAGESYYFQIHCGLGVEIPKRRTSTAVVSRRLRVQLRTADSVLRTAVERHLRTANQLRSPDLLRAADSHLRFAERGLPQSGVSSQFAVGQQSALDRSS